MLKLGDKSRVFVEKSLELALFDDSFLPRKFDLKEFQKDVELFVGMFKIVQAANTLQKKLEDTLKESRETLNQSLEILFCSTETL